MGCGLGNKIALPQSGEGFFVLRISWGRPLQVGKKNSGGIRLLENDVCLPDSFTTLSELYGRNEMFKDRYHEEGL